MDFHNLLRLKPLRSMRTAISSRMASPHQSTN